MALCALIAMQWVREAHMHQKVQELINHLQDKTEAIQSLERMLGEEGRGGNRGARGEG